MWLDMLPSWCHYGTMNLTTYIEMLRQQLTSSAELGGEETRAIADQLSTGLESAARLVLLQALSAAADEITRELAPGAVELRLRGSEPDFVVTPPPAEIGDGVPVPVKPWALAESEEEDVTSRLNLRLPEALKLRIEAAARGEGLSINAWLVRMAAAAVDAPNTPTAQRSPGQRYTGWVR